jgi:hypothetical protein
MKKKKNFRWCALLLTCIACSTSSDHIQRVCYVIVWVWKMLLYVHVQYLHFFSMCMKSFFFVFILKKWVIIKHKTFSLVFTIVWTKTDMRATRLQLLMWKIKESFNLEKNQGSIKNCQFLKKIRKSTEKLEWKF